ncbi:MAG: hypothetical protein HUU41_13865 [Bryobacteraceae bacterium]|nr:hypothetical protein [Bryobacterales bacterium]NUN02195.1 hypothetical protein [Bryobacteraceae bacterium]
MRAPADVKARAMCNCVRLLASLWIAGTVLPAQTWIAATDEGLVKRTGMWTAGEFRHAGSGHLLTMEDGAALELSFTGAGVVLSLDAHGLSYARLGLENLGILEVTIDGRQSAAVLPQREDRDVVLARGLGDGAHMLRLVHRATAAGSGARVAGFRILRGGEGDLSFLLHGEANRFLNDIRAVVSKNGHVVRNSLIRNWLTGQCRIAGLPAGSGYQVELMAAGWQTQHLRDIEIKAGQETELQPVYLRRRPESTTSGVEFPRAGQPAIVRSGESFATRVFLAGVSIESVELRRQLGPATISREVVFREDKAREHDGRAEGIITLPAGVAPGLYDLVFRLPKKVSRSAPRAVYVVTEYPRNPVFVTFGHMDTFGQEAAEYLQRLAGLSNLIGADMVLVSNEVNAAYALGAFARLDMPHLITFGNHEVAGHQEFYGNAVSMIDYGPELSILNFSHAWHGDLSHAYALLESRAKTRCKIINAFEHDAPVEAMLDRYRISFLHDAHGPGPKVMQIGRTPTQRAGKANSESFRVVRFEGCRPVSFTYAGHPSAPIPLPRHQPAPMQLSFSTPNDGAARRVTARISNRWAQAFPNGRVVFVMPSGDCTVEGGRMESAIASDDGRFVVLTARADIPANADIEVTAESRQR